MPARIPAWLLWRFAAFVLLGCMVGFLIGLLTD